MQEPEGAVVNIFLLSGVGLIAVIVGGLFFLAHQSNAGSPPGLSGSALTPCPSSPNCVCSEQGTPDSHAVDPLPASSWATLPEAVEAAGGVIVERRDDYLAAAFKSRLLGFVDDVEFRKASDAVHVRSASRVGRSDLGDNRKRVEALRAALQD